MKRRRGFTLVELLCVLVILAILILLIGRLVVKNVQDAKTEITDTQEKAILNAAEKWSVNNSDLFDDTDGQKIMVGLDIIFILDASKTMNENMTGIGKRMDGLITATNEALEIFNENEDNRVGFVVFGGTFDASYNHITTASIRLKRDLKPVQTVEKMKALTYDKKTSSTGKITINSNGDFAFSVDGTTIQVTSLESGTYTMIGVQQAALMFASAGVEKGTRIPVYILVTDGEPTTGSTLDESNPFQMKNANIGNGRTLCLNRDDWIKREKSSSGYCSNFIIKNFSSADRYGAEQATLKNSELVYNVMRVAYLAKQKAGETYGSTSYFYTIGIGSLPPYANYMLSPSTDINTLGASTSTEPKSNTDQNLRYYLEHKAVKEYRYNKTDEAFLNVADFDELRESLTKIATTVKDAAKVTEVCVSVEELYNGGYLTTKDIDLPSDAATSQYVLMSFNEATNQYGFTLAKSNEQKKSCENYYANRKNEE